MKTRFNKKTLLCLSSFFLLIYLFHLIVVSIFFNYKLICLNDERKREQERNIEKKQHSLAIQIRRIKTRFHQAKLDFIRYKLAIIHIHESII